MRAETARHVLAGAPARAQRSGHPVLWLCLFLISLAALAVTVVRMDGALLPSITLGRVGWLLVACIPAVVYEAVARS